MFVRRDGGDPGPHLQLRMTLFGAGALCALAGIALELEWLVNVAIGLLGVAFVLRFIARRDEPSSDDRTPPA